MSRSHHHSHCRNRTQVKPVSMAFYNSDANDVRVTGSFCNWCSDGVALQRNPQDIWHGELHLAPGRYEYRILADGAWCDDPACMERVPNPFGSENCVLCVA